MEINKIANELRCYIELSLFDSFTGESFSKDFLDGKTRDRVTACEEALKLLNGADEASLMMSKDEIKSNLNDIYNLFKTGNEECRARGVTPSSMNVEAEEGFKAALETLSNIWEDNTMTQNEAAAKIIAHYGTAHQLVKLCEECAELTQQAAKCYDKGIPYSEDMIEEMADVIVMILQFEGIMSRPDSELLQKIVTEKLKRQLDRIESEVHDDP